MKHSTLFSYTVLEIKRLLATQKAKHFFSHFQMRPTMEGIVSKLWECLKGSGFVIKLVFLHLGWQHGYRN